ncbi:MAG: FliH/SctL family protein [Thermodesulfovibrionales bacterium]
MSFKGRIINRGEVSVFPMPELIEKDAEEIKTKEERPSIEEIEREAYERGFEAGEKAGLAMGEEKARIILERIENLLKDLLTLRERILVGLQPQIIELATALAKKIILQELKTAPEIIVNMTKEAIMRIERTGPVTIKINPSLYNLFMRLKPELQNIHEDLIFDVDPSLSTQGTLVIGPQEEVSTDVDEQLRNIIKELGDRIGNPQS